MNRRRGRRTLITGITGQDGSYLAELLIAEQYEVHGVIRRAPTFTTGRISHPYVDPHESPPLHFIIAISARGAYLSPKAGGLRGRESSEYRSASEAAEAAAALRKRLNP